VSDRVTCHGAPYVECLVCARIVPCVKLVDGTVYKPFGWTYPDADRPLMGVCQNHQTWSPYEEAFKP
jgi:hypothetical protein